MVSAKDFQPGELVMVTHNEVPELDGQLATIMEDQSGIATLNDGDGYDILMVRLLATGKEQGFYVHRPKKPKEQNDER